MFQCGNHGPAPLTLHPTSILFHGFATSATVYFCGQAGISRANITFAL